MVPPPDSEPSRPRYVVQVLVKALRLLDILADASAPLSLAELCERSSLPKSSVFQYLVTFEDQGYVERILDSERYRLGLKVFELGSVVAARFDIREAALPFMRRLLEDSRETVNLAILDGCDVVYLEILEGTHSIRMAALPGRRQSPHCTALGKAILAYMDPAAVDDLLSRCGMPALTPNTITSLDGMRSELARVRELGYAVDDIENEAGVRCVAAPIFDHLGGVAAAISLSGPEVRMTRPATEATGRALVSTAQAISRRLGYSS